MNAIDQLRAQGREFISALKDKNALIRGAFKTSAPRMLRGFVLEEIRDKSSSEVYSFLLRDIWDSIPGNMREFLISYKPWPLEWLTVEWVQETISITHPSIAAAISDSEKLRSSIQASIDKIVENLS